MNGRTPAALISRGGLRPASDRGAKTRATPRPIAFIFLLLVATLRAETADVLLAAAGDAAAIAHARGIRYIAFRVVSDAPYEGVPFYPMAARATTLFTVSFLENLPPLSP